MGPSACKKATYCTAEVLHAMRERSVISISSHMVIVSSSLHHPNTSKTNSNAAESPLLPTEKQADWNSIGLMFSVFDLKGLYLAQTFPLGNIFVYLFSLSNLLASKVTMSKYLCFQDAKRL